MRLLCFISFLSWVPSLVTATALDEWKRWVQLAGGEGSDVWDFIQNYPAPGDLDSLIQMSRTNIWFVTNVYSLPFPSIKRPDQDSDITRAKLCAECIGLMIVLNAQRVHSSAEGDFEELVERYMVKASEAGKRGWIQPIEFEKGELGSSSKKFTMDRPSSQASKCNVLLERHRTRCTYNDFNPGYRYSPTEEAPDSSSGQQSNDGTGEDTPPPKSDMQLSSDSSNQDWTKPVAAGVSTLGVLGSALFGGGVGGPAGVPQ